MAEYIPLDIHSYTPLTQTSNIQSQKYKLWVQGKENTKINNIEFSHSFPYKCAITAGTRVIFVDINEKDLSSQFTSFKNIANCTSYRQDDKLIAIGDDTGLLQVVETAHRTKLRRFKGHEGPIRSCAFLSSKTQLISGSDDKCVKLWDIAEEKCVFTHISHTDSIRQLAVSNVIGSSHLFLSSSYDGYIKLWDTRSPNKEVLSVNHDAPVEDIIIYPKSLLFASSGATNVKLWDFSTGKCVNTLKPQSKTITSIAITNDENFLYTSSLDKTVKCTNTYDYKVIKTFYYEHPVMKFRFSSDNDLFAAGLSDGSWSIKKYKTKNKDILADKDQQKSFKVAHKKSRYHHIKFQPENITKTVENIINFKSTPLEKLLKHFEYKEALDLALTLSSAHVISLIEELIQRGALYIALGDRDETTILPSIQFITRNLGTDFTHTSIILEALKTLLDENEWLYKSTDNVLIEMLRRLSQKIGFELTQQNQLQEVHGILDMILSV